MQNPSQKCEEKKWTLQILHNCLKMAQKKVNYGNATGIHKNVNANQQMMAEILETSGGRSPWRNVGILFICFYQRMGQ